MRHIRDGVAAMRRLVLFIAAVLTAAVLSQQPAWAAKNVILMIADGAGHNTWLAASMYQGKVGKQVYDQPGWLRFSCSTYPLSVSTKPTGDLKQDLVYDPKRAWPVYSLKLPDFSRLYLTTTCTDSAAAATAMATGQKTYNNAVNWSSDDRLLRGKTIAEIAKAQGKSVGVVTTVPWSDATPACLGGAHNRSRGNSAEIANEMLGCVWLDVIMGASHPDFDDDGRPLPATKKHDYRRVGGQDTWIALKSGERLWKLIEKKADFEALTSGPAPRKLLGVAQVGSTLQEKRVRPGNSAAGIVQPFAAPLNRNVPTLATMSKAAVNCLDDNPKGFYLMIEGGAVDWANHANEPDRMVEEQIDFLRAVEAVVAWVESHGGWNDTLLILTADHETGLLWGPHSAQTAFQPIEDRGAGKLPGMKYNSHGHSNSLVPLYARGRGSRRFAAMVKGNDVKAAACWHYSGQYVDNTDIFAVMRAEVTGEKD